MKYEELDLICLSHLRWDFVYQRPQHLLSRFAKERRVFFVEEPLRTDGPMYLDVSRREDNLWVARPHISQELSQKMTAETVQMLLLERLFVEQSIKDYLLWYYTPMANAWTHHLQPAAVVYDCMDELSAFKNAPRSLKYQESELLRRADLVFTGGHSLYEAKKHLHSQIYPFPSSIDKTHFAKARQTITEPADQAAIPGSRIGFFGVIDERLDIALLEGVAKARPDWQIVMIGPVVKIDPQNLPKLPNVHYLGSKDYKELPTYLAGWDVAMLPFARNESTRFISPTKTPEYLAAGRPVVSTSIRDVVRPYAENDLVAIADTVNDFVFAIEALLKMNEPEKNAWLNQVDRFLADLSWDKTWADMSVLLKAASLENRRVQTSVEETGAEIFSRWAGVTAVPVSSLDRSE